MKAMAAWQGLFDHGRLRAGTVLAHGAAGAVGSMVTQLAREAGAYVIGTATPPTARRCPRGRLRRRVRPKPTE
jgi:NADPH:quinone reductase-like Zn-dependent oxidoreductase